ncbi:hypothetical protein AAVH_08744 [Aphelenchoides avenae]|nr:hypothetical protein AAVH_08744 [Aphelenchus avenae]
MADDGDMVCSSESESEGGLEENFYSAKELLESGSGEEAIIALKTLVEMDTERTKWGFKALKKLVKLLMYEVLNQVFVDYYERIFPYVESKSVTTNDVDKALDSAWNKFCHNIADKDRRRRYCLVTFDYLRPFPALTTRLKWAARLAQQYKFDEYPYDVEKEVDDIQRLIQEAYNKEIISDNVREYLFVPLLLATRIFLKLRNLATVDLNLDCLKELISGEVERVEWSALVKELQSQVAFVRGKYSDSFVLLCDAKKLYEECGSSRTQQVCLQLRLMSMLLPSVELTLASIDAFPTHQHALVEDIVQCFLEDNVVRLRSELAVAETTLGRFAAVELCGALVRNRISRRMAAETWLDNLACLSRWDLDGLKVVGQRTSNLVDGNTHTLPLKNVASVRVESAHADQTIRDTPTTSDLYDRHNLRVSAHDGTLTIETQREIVGSNYAAPTEEAWKTFAVAATTESFPGYSECFSTRNVTHCALGCLKRMLVNACIERLDWVGNFSWPDTWSQERDAPALHIKCLNYALDARIPRLPPLESLGKVSVGHFEISVPSWDSLFNKDLRTLFRPLEGMKLESISVDCSRMGSSDEGSLLDACFIQHTAVPMHFVVRNALFSSDFLVRVARKARASRCECAVSLEVITRAAVFLFDNFTYLDESDLPDCVREDLGQTRIFEFNWPRNSLRIEMEPFKLVARYSWKGTGVE